MRSRWFPARCAGAGLLMLAALLAPLAQANADLVEGVRFAHQRLLAEPAAERAVAPAPTLLLLSGTHVSRWNGLIKVSVGGLWLPADARGRDVLDPAVAKLLEMHYLVGISGQRLADGTRDILARNWPPEALARQRGELDTLINAFTDVGAGDSYALQLQPGRGVSLARNGRVVARAASDETARMIFSVWLGRDPLDMKNKQALLEYRQQRRVDAAAPR